MWQNDSTGTSGLRCADSGHGYAGSGTEAQDERCAGIWAGGGTADDRANLGSFNACSMWDLPACFFKLFFDNEVFFLLANNTNAYAAARGAGPAGQSSMGWGALYTSNS